MPFDRPTLQTIYDRMITGIESRLTGGLPLLRRALLRILAKVFSGAVHIAYGFIAFIADQLFIDTAETNFLERQGAIYGIPRKSGTFAEGGVDFAGSNGTVIPEGTKLVRDDGFEYATLEEGTIAGGTVEIDVQALEAGADGNYDYVGAPDYAKLSLVTPISGVTSDGITLAEDIEGGQDEETDDDYRTRILQRIQNPPSGGTATDYVRWTLESEPTVNGAWCFPLVLGPGSVGVVFRVSDTDPVPGPPLFVDGGSGYDDGTGTVYIYLADRKPVTSDLYVYPIDKKEVEFWITITPNEQAFRDSIDENMADLFDNIAAPGEDLLISQIRDAIMNSGVTDYEITSIEVEGAPVPVDDIAFTGFEYAVLKEITYA